MRPAQLETSAMRITRPVLLGIFYLLSFLFDGVSAEAKRAPGESQILTVSVYNDAGIPQETVKDAEVVASRIFDLSRIHIEWMNCFVLESGGPGAHCDRDVSRGHLQVRIGRHSLNLRDSVLGISYLSDDGEGSQADIFYEQIRALSPDTSANPEVMLGHVMAHEIGHLLLGTNSHSLSGIMIARWHKQEITRASNGMMRFDEGQAERMSAHLSDAIARMNCPVELPGDAAVHESRRGTEMAQGDDFRRK
jgi:hypothetical protein